MELYIEVVALSAMVVLATALIKRRSIKGMIPSALVGAICLLTLGQINVENTPILIINAFTATITAFFGAPGVFCMAVLRLISI